MYKDKDKQREANKAAKARYKAKLAQLNKEERADIFVREALGIPIEGIPDRGIPSIYNQFPDKGIPERVIPEQQDPYPMLPPLPVDQLITANTSVTWADIIALSRWVIDEVYHIATVMDDELLLRLVRAAGYCKRTT